MLRTCRIAALAAVLIVFIASFSHAQDPPPKIGPFVVDLHGTVPRFPESEQLALSRAMLLDELPGVGLGLHGGVHVYPFRVKAVTFGFGVDATFAQASQSAPQRSESVFGRAATERFTHIAPEISFNFGTGNGWSYVSGGIGPGVWSVVAEGGPTLAANSERLKTINYGGGARWFLRRHLAFSIDVRFYAINPSTPANGLPGGPRETLLFIGAGISVN